MHAKLIALFVLLLPLSHQLRSATAQDAAPSEGSIEIELQPVPPHIARPVVTALAAARDGRFLAVAGDDHVIRLYRFDAEQAFPNRSEHEPSPSDKLITTKVRGLTLVANLEGHSDWIQTLVFSSDSKQLYSSGNDGRVLRWEYGANSKPTEITQLPYAVHSLSLSTQRQLLAIGGFSDQVGLWDLKAGDWKAHLACSCNDQRCVRFSPDGTLLLSGGRDGAIHVWDTETAAEKSVLRAHRDRVQTAMFSADGNVITSVGDDRRLVRYDLTTEQVILDRDLKGAKLRSMNLINDNLIAAAGAGNKIHVFDVLADSELGVLNGHTGSVAVMCSAAGFLISGSFDTTVRLWKIESAVSAEPGFAKPVGLAPLDADPNMEIR